MTPTDNSDDSYFVSKSQRKRDMNALQDLGKMLTEYTPARLAKVPMSDNLRQALVEMQRISSNGARARQLQYIGKLMRDEDAGVIRNALDALAGTSRAENARMHRLEKMRDDLMEDETKLTELGNLYPGADLQRFRQLRRNAIKEKAESRPPRAFREIFQMLRELDSGAAPAPSAPADESEAGDE